MRPSRVGVPVDFPRICLPRSVDSSSPALSETMLGSQEARRGRGPDSIGRRSGPSLCIPRAALWWHPVPPPSSNRIHLVPCPPSVAPLCWVMTQLGMPGVGMGWRMRRATTPAGHSPPRSRQTMGWVTRSTRTLRGNSDSCLAPFSSLWWLQRRVQG